MTSSIDKEIESMMIKDGTPLHNSSHVRSCLGELDNYLLEHKLKGWSPIIYGLALHGLATTYDTVDICVTNTRSSTTTQQPIITQDNVNFESSDISDNTEVVNVNTLANHLRSVSMNNNKYTINVFSQNPVPYLTVKKHNCYTVLKISIDNKLDIERSNLITEYLSLGKRVGPFLFALKQFIARKGIDNEEKGYPNQHVFVMMGLYFLMFVQDPPVIPCLHSMLNNTPCNYPVCRSKTNEKVQGFDVTYHDCARFDRIAEYDPLPRNTAINLYGTPWVSRNIKSAGGLLLEAFKWFSYTATILEPKSINSKEPPVLQPEWDSNFMVFADVFDPKLNIAASCTVEGAKIINQTFFNAYVKLKDGNSFENVSFSYDEILTPIATKASKYTRGVPEA